MKIGQPPSEVIARMFIVVNHEGKWAGGGTIEFDPTRQTPEKFVEEWNLTEVVNGEGYVIYEVDITLEVPRRANLSRLHGKVKGREIASKYFDEVEVELMDGRVMLSERAATVFMSLEEYEKEKKQGLR